MDLKYQTGSEMHTSNTLSHLHNLTDTPDNKDVIPLNFLQHFTPNYIEHAYSCWVEHLYTHKRKDFDTMKVKRKCGRPPNSKQDSVNLNPKTAATSHTTQPCQANKKTNNEVILRDLIEKANVE